MKRRALRGASVVSAIGLAAMPKVICPACWPLYAAVLSALGIGFVPTSTWLLPATVVFLVIAVIALGARGRQGALIVGVAASALVLLGKFRFESQLPVYIGIALLVIASLLSWRRHTPAAVLCPTCANQHHERR